VNEPTFYLSEDETFLVFIHECGDVEAEWREAGHPLDAESVARFQEARNRRELPLGWTGWTLVAREPLEISPSVLCGNCDLHGFIIEGKWVAA
jgi:hypothetical protein